MPADPLGDLATAGNTLSFWLVEDDRSNLDQVVTALASNCDRVSNIDYGLVRPDDVRRIGIAIEKSLGASADRKANEFPP